MAASFNDPSRAKSLGARLRRARTNANFTQEMLWAETGVNHSQISRIERGDFSGPGTNVQILCAYFRIDWRLESSVAPLMAHAHAGTPHSSRKARKTGRAMKAGPPECELVTRLARAAAASPEWASALEALAEAIETALRIPPKA
ncbi:helix-turn-helix domain-containing protein [Variovorax sp. YR266]|uniref:helix-turn-helix domain-containing protein n=1 Tax=Variovorax sp. YR266 TaxID=1884386 RepID=UPI0035253665